jgi:hypothetical protein
MSGLDRAAPAGGVKRARRGEPCDPDGALGRDHWPIRSRRTAVTLYSGVPTGSRAFDVTTAYVATMELQKRWFYRKAA